MKSIMEFNADECIECGRKGTETHHVIFGSSNRKNSEKYGLKVRLCTECHRRLHDQDEQLAMKYRKLGQQYFEARWGHDKFMEVFGKNYL